MPNAASRPARRAQSLPLGVAPKDANHFARWLHGQDMTAAEFRARLLREDVEVCIHTIYAWRAGRGVPKRTTAVLIERLTKGAVTVAGW